VGFDTIINKIAHEFKALPDFFFQTDDAYRIGIDWEKGSSQMIVVGDGSFIPPYIHNLAIHIGEWQITAPIGFSERLGVGFNILGRKGVINDLHLNDC
jgi:hypothetical protein